MFAHTLRGALAALALFSAAPALAEISVEKVPPPCGADGVIPASYSGQENAQKMCVGFTDKGQSSEIKAAYKACGTYYNEVFFALANHCQFMAQALQMKSEMKDHAAKTASKQNSLFDTTVYTYGSSASFTDTWRAFFFEEGHRLRDDYNAYDDKLKTLADKGDDLMDSEVGKCGTPGYPTSLEYIGLAAVSAADLVGNHGPIAKFMADAFYQTTLAANQMKANERAVQARPGVSAVGAEGEPESEPNAYALSAGTTTAAHGASKALEHAGESVAKNAPLVGPAVDLGTRMILHRRLTRVDYVFSGIRFALAGAAMFGAPVTFGGSLAADVAVDSALTVVEESINKRLNKLHDAHKKELAELLNAHAQENPDSPTISKLYHAKEQDGFCGAPFVAKPGQGFGDPGMPGSPGHSD